MAEFEIKEYDSIVQDIVEYLIENSTELTDLNKGSVIRSLIEAISLEFNSEIDNGVYQQLQNIYNSSRVSTATNDDLDELAKLVNITRKDGTKANTYLTLKRTSPTPLEFTVNIGTIFSTQPSVNTSALRFVTTEELIFKTNITGEEYNFKNGIYNYKLNQRFYNEISEISGTSGSSPKIFTENTDYQLVKNYNGNIVNIDTIDPIDECEVITDWVKSTDATTIATDAVNYRQGTYSLKLGKNGTSESFFSYSKTYTASSDLTNKYLNFKLRIEDSITLDKINDIEIYLGNDVSNYLKFTISNLNLETGWNEIFLNPSDASIIGSPSIINITYFNLKINTNSASDIITSGNINLDYIIFCEIESYKGDIIEWLATGALPDDGTDYSVDYIPLSLEIQVESEEVGSEYNVAEGKIIQKVTNLPEITSVNNYNGALNGTGIESDEDLRERITNAAFATGKATVKAIKTALENLAYVSSANVEDTPLKHKSGETFVYSTGTNIYKLDYEVAQNNINLSVTGPGPTTYVEGTDFNLTDLSEIEFGIGGTDPSDTDLITVDYDYKWLGHIEISVVGPATFTTEQETEIEETIDDTKAAGVVYTWSSPTYVAINVTVGINIISGYAFDDVKIVVEDAIRNKLNSYDVGENVYLSQLIDTIMDVDGVNYCSLTSPVADVTIGSSEVAKDGTIIINNI